MQFYIQNYGYPEGPATGDFQIYGFYQFDLSPISWEELVQNSNSPEYANMSYIEFAGLRGFEGQFSGQRNRYIYLFHLDGRVLNIAVSEPTEANKQLADEIIATIALLDWYTRLRINFSTPN